MNASIWSSNDEIILFYKGQNGMLEVTTTTTILAGVSTPKEMDIKNPQI